MLFDPSKDKSADKALLGSYLGSSYQQVFFRQLLQDCRKPTASFLTWLIYSYGLCQHSGYLKDRSWSEDSDVWSSLLALGADINLPLNSHVCTLLLELGNISLWRYISAQPLKILLKYGKEDEKQQRLIIDLLRAMSTMDNPHLPDIVATYQLEELFSRIVS